MNTKERGETKNAMKNKENEKLSLRERTTEGESKRGGKKREIKSLKVIQRKRSCKKSAEAGGVYSPQPSDAGPR